MFAPSFTELLILLILPLLNRGERLPDLLSLVDPQAGLESIGEKTDEESLRRLIEGKDAADAGGGDAAYDKKEAESSIQNLASATDSVREKAREKLLSIGPAIRARLEEVVAKDPRRADEAKKVLDGLGAARAAKASVRATARTLAIRLAQEKSLTKLAPALREAEKAESVFVSRAAREVLLALEGGRSGDAAKSEDAAKRGDAAKDAKAGPASAPPCAALEALPGATRVLLAIGSGRTGSGSGQELRLDKLFKSVLGTLGAAGGPPPAEIEKMIRETTQHIVQLAAAYGNLRIEDLYVANVGSVGPRGGGLAIIATGDYERAVLEAGLEKNTALWTVGEAEGKKVFTSMAARVLPLDDHAVLILPQVASKNFPLAEYLASFKDSKRALRSEPRWDKFLATLKDSSSPIRGLAITDASLMTEIHGEMDRDSSVKPEVRDAVKGMKELELDVAPVEGTKLRYRLEGTFAEADHAKDLVQFLKDSIQQGISEMEQAAAQLDIPQMKAGIDLAKSIRLASDGRKGILRLEVDPMALIGSMGVGLPVQRAFR